MARPRDADQRRATPRQLELRDNVSNVSNVSKPPWLLGIRRLATSGPHLTLLTLATLLTYLTLATLLTLVTLSRKHEHG